VHQTLRTALLIFPKWIGRRARRTHLKSRTASCLGKALLGVCLITAAISRTTAADLRLVHQLKSKSRISAALVSPDGTRATTMSGGLEFWDLTTGELIGNSNSAYRCGEIPPMWISTDGALAAFNCNGIVLVDLRVPQVVARLGAGSGRTEWIGLDRDQRRLVRTFNRPTRDESIGVGLVVDNFFEIYDIDGYSDPSWLGNLKRSWWGYDSLEPETTFRDRTLWDSRVRGAVFDDASNRLVFDRGDHIEVRSPHGQIIDKHTRQEAHLVPRACDSQRPQLLSAERNLSHGRMLGAIETDGSSDPTPCRFSVDGTEVVFLRRNVLTAWDDTGTKLWDSGNQRVYGTYFDASADRQWIASATDYGEVAVLSWKGEVMARGAVKPEVLRAIPPEGGSCHAKIRVSVSADGRTVLFVYCDLFVWRRE
jgi:hypothetical protein